LDNWTLNPETRLRATSDIGFSIFSALLSATLRHSDHEQVGDLLVSIFRSHHGDYFVDGLRKLGLDSEESDAIKSAKYHYFSNVIGGIDMGYAQESNRKAWVFYKTPFCYFDSPQWPSASAAFMRPEGYAAVFRAWHGNNGRSLGNPRLAFHFTHMLFRGDPYDAGYFEEHHEALSPDQTYQEHWGETPPPMTTLEFGPAWTLERRLKAVSNYHAGYVGDSVQHLVSAFGVADAAAIVEHAYRVFLLQARQRIAGYLGVSLEDPRAPALMLARFLQLFREEVDVASEGSETRITQAGSYAARFVTKPLPAEVEAAITSAWAGLAEYLSPGNALRQTATLAQGEARSEWVFTAG
jgi:hypothetical protein